VSVTTTTHALRDRLSRLFEYHWGIIDSCRQERYLLTSCADLLYCIHSLAAESRNLQWNRTWIARSQCRLRSLWNIWTFHSFTSCDSSATSAAIRKCHYLIPSSYVLLFRYCIMVIDSLYLAYSVSEYADLKCCLFTAYKAERTVTLPASKWNKVSLSLALSHSFCPVSCVGFHAHFSKCNFSALFCVKFENERIMDKRCVSASIYPKRLTGVEI
jgi:hypothetical protein